MKIYKQSTNQPHLELNDSEYVMSFAPLVTFLGEALGRATEVVLHDVADLDHSVVAIANGEVTGRKVGSPATDLIIRAVHTKQYDNREFVTGYTVNSDVPRSLRSATYFIRKDGRIVGALCLNADQTLLRNLDALVSQIGNAYFSNLDDRDQETEEEKPELIANSISEITSTAIDTAFGQRPYPVAHYTQEDRLEIVRILDEDGFFQLRGAVSVLASRLLVSEPTIYRYLKQSRS
ncbi:helix-turn-helix transcriptional regulator [Flaviflexus massiliensis]|uniref:helix-turn-helix transcriptional regulator n=1 Tax=Flaviflexus massiliensis TaxID=1522309 RepID=UPI000AA6E294|nr:PAS domain-containing protein [Flaviflexus massiliensis]